jgi:succinate dehydrogenase/fumarate reductase flavoprotein subunit
MPVSGEAALTAKNSNVFAVDNLEEACRTNEFDVVIVGGGGAGASAAIEAADLGASVLILEKTFTPGGSTEQSGGNIRLVLDREGSIEHYWSLCQGATPKEIIEAFVDGLLELPEWAESHDGELVPVAESQNYSRWVFPSRSPGTYFPTVTGGVSVGQRARLKPATPERERGEALWDFLSRNLMRLGVPTYVGARVSRLIEDSRRRVVGVEVEGPGGKPIRVSARKAVILCCGGFAYDPDMVRQYLGISLPAQSPPGRNAGDGVRLAQQVGADLWHMSGVTATVGYQFPEYGAGFHCRMPDPGFVMVDQNARRYTCETDLKNHAAHFAMLIQDTVTGNFSRVPSYVIFDEVTRKAGYIVSLDSGENRHYPWSKDNSKEIERGWITQAESLEELAELLGLNPKALLDTINEFNTSALEGSPDVFGRAPDLIRSIDSPPFYGAAVYPSLINTQGGPRRNAEAAVLRPDGSAVPGLFAAGELGSIWNRLYPGAGNISECLVFGRIAGRNATRNEIAARELAEGVRI